MENFWDGMAIAVFGGLTVVFVGWACKEVFARWRAREKKIAGRHDGYLWRRREAFDDLLADFRPIHKRWSRQQGVLLRKQFGQVSDTDGEPEPEVVEDLQARLMKLLSQLSDRSPSEVLRQAVASATKKHEAIERALIFNNHALTVGNDENKEDACSEFHEKMDAYDKAVRELSKVAFEDGQPRARRKVEPVSVIGIVVFAVVAVVLVWWAFSVDALWARVVLMVFALASAAMLAGPISTLWKPDGEPKGDEGEAGTGKPAQNG